MLYCRSWHKLCGLYDICTLCALSYRLLTHRCYGSKVQAGCKTSPCKWSSCKDGVEHAGQACELPANLFHSIHLRSWITAAEVNILGRVTVMHLGMQQASGEGGSHSGWKETVVMALLIAMSPGCLPLGVGFQMILFNLLQEWVGFNRKQPNRREDSLTFPVQI